MSPVSPVVNSVGWPREGLEPNADPEAEVWSNLGPGADTGLLPQPAYGTAYAVTYDNQRSGPALAHAYAGRGDEPAQVSWTDVVWGGGYLYCRWDTVTVPVGGTACLLHFAIQREPDDEAGAEDQAMTWSTSPTPTRSLASPTRKGPAS